MQSLNNSRETGKWPLQPHNLKIWVDALLEANGALEHFIVPAVETRLLSHLLLFDEHLSGSTPELNKRYQVVCVKSKIIPVQPPCSGSLSEK